MRRQGWPGPLRRRPGLLATAELVVAWLLIRHAAVALKKLPENAGDKPFYEGKIASARFFARTVLPGLALARQHVEQSSLELMELAEDCY